MRFHEVPNCRETFGDIGPFVKQSRRFLEQGEVDAPRPPAKLLETRNRFLEEARRLVIAEEPEIGRPRHGIGKVCAGRHRRLRHPRAGIDIRRVECRRCIEDLRGVCNRQREYRYAIKRTACRHNACSGNETTGGFEPHDIVEGSRNTARPRRIRAQREGYNPACHRHRRAGRRTARDIIRIEDRPRRAVRRARSDEPRRELIEIGLAKGNGARRNEALHHHCMPFGCIGKGRTGRRRRQPRHIDIVLHGKGNAKKRHHRLLRRGKRV